MKMPNAIVHAAERKAFELVLNQVIKTANKEDGYIKVIDTAQKFLGDTWSPKAFDNLRATFTKGEKYANFFDRILRDVDPEVVKGLFMAFGFEAGYVGYHETRKNAEKYNINVPWVILFDPTSACNLHCVGCWASEYSRTLNLSYEDMDRIVTQGKALGTRAYVLTGGEPMVRKKDIVKLAKAHKDCGFMIFTNGTLVDQQFCDDMKECKNIVLSMSIEGLESATDNRRGAGVFDKVMKTMDLLRENRLPYGTSICYTSANYKAVTSDEFLDFLIDKGVLFSWYFHFMPTGNDTTMELVPTPEQDITAARKSSLWTSRMTASGYPDVSPEVRRTSTSTRMATQSRAYSSIIPEPISMRTAFSSACSSRCSRHITTDSRSATTCFVPARCWRILQSFARWFTQPAPSLPI